jgi:hypothetical protein
MENLAGMPEPVETGSDLINGELLEHWVYRCPNGFGVSVLLGERGPHMQYTRRHDGLYEIGVIKFTGESWGLSRLPEVTDKWPDHTVRGWQTLAEVQDIYQKVAAHGK